MIRQRAIPDTTLEDGLDRQNLTLLRKRFLSINTDRLERMRSALNSHQQLCLDALPLLFHTNHPMMPGFVSQLLPQRAATQPSPKAARRRVYSVVLQQVPLRPVKP